MWLLLIFGLVAAGFLALFVAWVNAVRRSRRLSKIFKSASAEEQQWLQERTEGSDIGNFLLPMLWWQVCLVLAVIAVLAAHQLLSKL